MTKNHAAYLSFFFSYLSIALPYFRIEISQKVPGKIKASALTDIALTNSKMRPISKIYIAPSICIK